MLRTPLAAGVLVLALTGLSACGGDTKDTPEASGSPDVQLLTDDQAHQALISASQMGQGFTGAEPTEDDSNTDMGCLNALDDLDKLGSETEAKIEFTSTSSSGLPTLENDVYSYPDSERISSRIQDVVTALEGCDKVDVTGEDGTRFLLDVSVDTDTTSDKADEQVTLEATGTVSQGKQHFPIALHMTSARVDNNVTVVIFTDMPEDQASSSEQFDSYVTAATDRLAAVVAGQTPSEDQLT